MIAISLPADVSTRMPELSSICQRFPIDRLELFGSAATGEFDDTTSDLDFLVTFKPLLPEPRANAYLGLLEALQDLFQREIDLVEVEAIENPYFRQAVDQQRKLLYAA